ITLRNNDEHSMRRVSSCRETCSPARHGGSCHSNGCRMNISLADNSTPTPTILPFRQHHRPDRHGHSPRNLQTGEASSKTLDTDGNGGRVQRRHGNNYLHHPSHLSRRLPPLPLPGGAHLRSDLRRWSTSRTARSATRSPPLNPRARSDVST